jgi:hypothetical protein
VVVTVETVGAGVVVVVCSEVVVRLYGVEPQPDRTAMPPINVIQVARRTYDLLLIMIWILESRGMEVLVSGGSDPAGRIV